MYYGYFFDLQRTHRELTEHAVKCAVYIATQISPDTRPRPQDNNNNKITFGKVTTSG